MTERNSESRTRAIDGSTTAPGAQLMSETLPLDSELSGAEALAQLDATDAMSAPVVDDNQVLVGVVQASQLALLRLDPDAEVEDAMSRVIMAATEGATIAEVAQLMASQQIDRLPIINREGRLLGVVTALDLVRWFAGKL